MRPGITIEPDVLVFRTPSLRRKWEEIQEHWLAVEVYSPQSVIREGDRGRRAAAGPERAR